MAGIIDRAWPRDEHCSKRPAQTGKVEKPNITFGVFPITNYGVVYLSLQQGFFQAEGLNVTPRVMGANPIAGIVGGDFDTGGVTWTAFLLATNRGIPLRPLSEADRGIEGTGAVHGQERFADQDAPKISSARRSRWSPSAEPAISSSTMSCTRRVSTTNRSATPCMGVPDMAPTVLRGGVDAACIPEPLLSVVQAQGGLRSVFDLFSGEYDRFPLVGFPVTQKFAESNPNTVAALQRALAKGLAFAHNNPGQAARHLSDLHHAAARARAQDRPLLHAGKERLHAAEEDRRPDGPAADAARQDASCRTSQRRDNERLARTQRTLGPASVNRGRWPVQIFVHRAATAFRVALGIFVFFLILEFVTRLELVPPIYLPRASTVVHRMVELLQDPKFLEHVLATLHAWAVGLALATLISVPIGILIGTSELAYKMSSPLIEFMRPIPSVALIPLGILLWGQGFPMKVILVAYATTWPILFNTVYGVHDVDPIAVQTARCFGLKQVAILRHISLPSAAPFIFTGIRISASIGLIVVIGAELLASADSGIGSYILFVSSSGGQMDSVLAGAAIAGIVGALINSVLGLIDRHFFAWRYLGATPS